MKNISALKLFIIVAELLAVAKAGPYNEPGIGGFVDANYHSTSPGSSGAVINPVFRGWADSVYSYEPTPEVGGFWTDYTLALGQVTGDPYDGVVSLGDLTQDEINAGVPPGQITLTFGNPDEPNDPCHIRDGAGYDFVIFENGFAAIESNQSGGSIAGQIFADLGYVEVSSDGINFARFPSISLTPAKVGRYGTIDITNVYNLAGKHPNGYGVCTGTPFDLNELGNDPNVVNGIVDLNDIVYVRIVDIPGSGNFFDNARHFVDPCSYPDLNYFEANHPVYDAWPTIDSGGFDLEAIGVLKPQQYRGDINLDGIVNIDDFIILANTWRKSFGQPGWISRCDISNPKDMVIDLEDLKVFALCWLKKEQWRN